MDTGKVEPGKPHESRPKNTQIGGGLKPLGWVYECSWCITTRRGFAWFTHIEQYRLDQRDCDPIEVKATAFQSSETTG